MSNLGKLNLSDHDMIIDSIRQRTGLIEELCMVVGQEKTIEVLLNNTRYMDREDVETAVRNALNGETRNFIKMLEDGD